MGSFLFLVLKFVHFLENGEQKELKNTKKTHPLTNSGTDNIQ